MLRNLDIKNIAVIEKLGAEFSGGMTVLTGETGAGKSIIIDSINMILGARATKTLIRYGEEKASVSASFDVTDELIKKLEELGIDCEDDCLLLSREISIDGKSTARINGMMMPSAILKEISENLINIHGQQDNQAILNSNKHIDFLDEYAKTECELAEYAKQYAVLREIEAELEKSRVDEAEKQRIIDLLEYQTDEIEKADLKQGEKEELLEEREIIRNSARLAGGVAAAYAMLYENEQGSAYDAVSSAEAALEPIAGFDKSLAEISTRLGDVKYALEDIVHELRGMEFEYNESALNDIEERLDTIGRLEKKYGGSVEAVLEFYRKASAELEKAINNDEYIKHLEEKLADEREKLVALAEELYIKRSHAAADLSGKILAELADLDMEKASFEVNLEHGREFYRNGMDRAEFLITTNPGEPLKPLTKVASGGELSRVMLAVKTVLAASGETLIFDEIDTGVSGKAAQKIAYKLWSLGRKSQVICISHQPQLAAFADNHFRIEKEVGESSARTRLVELSSEERRGEIARIIDGADITETALKHAEEMITTAVERKFRL